MKYSPMLATKETPSDLRVLRFPMYGSIKLDGIRAIVRDGVVLSRKLRPIPSAFVQRTFNHLEGFDGELGIEDLHSTSFYRQTYSRTMTHGCEEKVFFYVFDTLDHDVIYEKRLAHLKKWARGRRTYPAVLLEQRLLRNAEELTEMEEEALAAGHEGLIVRSPAGGYKTGRCTITDQWLVKIKRTHDSEARIIRFEELMHNANEMKRDALGHAKRSSHKENKVPMNTLGALVCEDLKSGVQFRIGIFKGFSKAELQELWNKRRMLGGAIVKYASLKHGVKDKPRHARLLGFRSKIDL